MKIEIQNPWIILAAIALIILLIAVGGYTLGSIKLPGGVEIVLSPPPNQIVESTPQYVDPFYATSAPISPNPIESYVSYWQNVSVGNFESSWAQLSLRFRQDRHNNDFSSYVQDYKGKNYCRIEVSNARITQQDSNSAVVTANLSYFTGAQCNPVEYEIESRLIFDNTTNSWLYDETVNITAK